jgi:hypothetical protein
MNKWILRLFVALLTFLLSVALTGAFRFLFGGGVREMVLEAPRPYFEFSEDQDRIAAIYSEYGAAQSRHDRAFFEQIETENFVLFSGDRRFSREEDIQWMESQPPDLVYELRVHRIRVLGNSAVARGFISVTYPNGGTNEWPFIDVWVRRNGVWQIQSTTSVE